MSFSHIFLVCKTDAKALDNYFKHLLSNKLQCVLFSDDFKPASVDINKIATVDVAKTNEVTVTVPHLGK